MPHLRLNSCCFSLHLLKNLKSHYRSFWFCSDSWVMNLPWEKSSWETQKSREWAWRSRRSWRSLPWTEKQRSWRYSLQKGKLASAIVVLDSLPSSCSPLISGTWCLRSRESVPQRSSSHWNRRTSDDEQFTYQDSERNSEETKQFLWLSSN